MPRALNEQASADQLGMVTTGVSLTPLQGLWQARNSCRGSPFSIVTEQQWRENINTETISLLCRPANQTLPNLFPKPFVSIQLVLLFVSIGGHYIQHCLQLFRRAGNQSYIISIQLQSHSRHYQLIHLQPDWARMSKSSSAKRQYKKGERTPPC